MKRGLIMKVSKRKAVILTKDGSFERVRLKKGEQPAVGQEYICPSEGVGTSFRPNRVLLPSFSLALVAIIVFVLVAGGLPFGHQKASAAAYVSFDINPSIEVAVDKDMNIVKVRALNEDAKSLLSGSEGFEDSSLLYFSQSLFEMLEEYGYFDTYEDMLITSSYEKDEASSEVRKRLKDAIEQLRSDKAIQSTSIVVSVMETSSNTRKKANELGLSMGKFLVYKDAADQDGNLTADHVRTLSYSELRKLLVDGKQKGTEEAALPEVSENEETKEIKKTNHESNDSKPITVTTKSEKPVITTKKQVKEKTEHLAPSTDVQPPNASTPKNTAPKASEPKSDEDDNEENEEKENEDKEEREDKDRQDNEKEEDEDDGKDVSRKDSDRSHSSKEKKEEGLRVKIKVHIGGLNEHLPAESLKDLDLLQIQFIHNR